ncbi:MAG TPA: Crp/Fnr family transcriptional regulator [Candidatus Acidoferrum sp.]|nr:Crp/Fnr family transcriptional regulator [Candidatus Acidoferrum sp.]
MHSSSGLVPSRSCRACVFRKGGFFCQLSPLQLNDFDKIKSISVCLPGTLLFTPQQIPNGFYVVCEGEVKLYLRSISGKTVILRIARPGELVGLWAALLDAPHETSAETLGQCQVAFVAKEAFQQYLEKYPSILRRVLRYLAQDYRASCEQLATIGLGTTVVEKTASFLLEWSARSGVVMNNARFSLPFGQEVIAEHLGTTRESVARAISHLKKRGLLEVDGQSFLIPDRAALLCSHIHGRPRGPQLVRLSVARSRAAS